VYSWGNCFCNRAIFGASLTTIYGYRDAAGHNPDDEILLDKNFLKQRLGDDQAVESLGCIHCVM